LHEVFCGDDFYLAALHILAAYECRGARRMVGVMMRINNRDDRLVR
jgi:hypothetical protein